ncbi:hypothetical protein QRD02_10090 [Aequorivita sp. SDUM287046]|uniref:Lipoprotein n=1 Tax=Aequorivita aurantiaca TaxID=3053356 RepID=A0ABT8DIU4_9FLAO|nr:hypothetical protein [Aequorivita aurantiaca]MDN3724734.1 hypothetical protein [Aequorivita aurantiaca]
MKVKLFFLCTLALSFVGCHFTETMVLNPDGSGTISVEANMNEMMAFGGAGMADSMFVKMDTIIYMKKFLEEKKDSIAKLPASEQQKLKKMEKFNLHIKMDTENSEMIYDISTNFKNISEANDIVNGIEQIDKMMPNDPNSETKKEDTPEVFGVNYTFDKGIFKRDAYIKNEKLHQQEVDSLQQAEAFMASSDYTLKYTFPRKIKKVSTPDAVISEDKKSLTLQRPFLDYYKNPDVLDLEVVLEK